MWRLHGRSQLGKNQPCKTIIQDIKKVLPKLIKLYNEWEVFQFILFRAGIIELYLQKTQLIAMLCVYLQISDIVL